VLILHRISQFLALMGLPGLMAISFLDSAVMPLSGGPDAVVLLLAWQSPTLALVAAAVGALGSALGCLVLYAFGMRSGEKALARFSPRRIEWVKGKMKRNGLWAIILAVVAPPPFPTKLVILAAGVFRFKKARLAGAVFAGRFFRYAAVAFLGAQAGFRTSEVIIDNLPVLTFMLIGGILLFYMVKSHYSPENSLGGQLRFLK
jgi:membrane protein YqaA with SNARE-associated domain